MALFLPRRSLGIFQIMKCLWGRPLPPLPNLEVSDGVEKAADHALVWINKLLAVGHDIATEKDRNVFIKRCKHFEIGGDKKGKGIYVH